MLRRMQVRPGYMLKGELRLAQLELQRANIDVQRAVKIWMQVKAQCCKEGTLFLDRAIGIIVGGSGGHAMAPRHNAADLHWTPGPVAERIWPSCHCGSAVRNERNFK